MVLISSFASASLIWALIPLLRHGMLDHPNFRSSHQRPTPSGGGVAFVLVSIFTSALALLKGDSDGVPLSCLSLLSLPLAVVGLLDDRYKLSAGLRYTVQLATALLLILFSPLPLPWLALPLVLIVVTAVINFINFMDGLDGLVAGSMAVAIASVAIATAAPWPLWALVGSLFGFLLWNWSPARVFMGDVGSTFLGAVFAGLVLQSESWSDAFSYLLVATPLLVDACLCILRRAIAGQGVFQAHRLHLFQRLHQAGWSHRRVAILYIVATSVLAAVMLLGGSHWVLALAAVEICVGLYLDRFVAVPFSASQRG